MRDDNLSRLFFQRGEVPIIFGYSPKRHRECAELIIMKKQQALGIGSQRNLVIVDTEFNNNNEIIAKATSDNGSPFNA